MKRVKVLSFGLIIVAFALMTFFAIPRVGVSYAEEAYAEEIAVESQATQSAEVLEPLAEIAPEKPAEKPKANAKKNGFCAGWVAVILSGLIFCGLIVAIFNKKVRKIMVFLSIASLIATLIIVIVHPCSVAGLGFALAVAFCLLAFYLCSRVGRRQCAEKSEAPHVKEKVPAEIGKIPAEEAEVPVEESAPAEEVKEMPPVESILAEEGAATEVPIEEKTEAPVENVIETPVEEKVEVNVFAESVKENKTLKESLERANETNSAKKIGKKFVCEHLVKRFGDKVIINTRGNYTSTGLPLADTHYVVNKKKNSCFIYVYETAGTAMFLLKITPNYLEELKKKHENVNRSAFPKSKDFWCSLICDDSFGKKELRTILEDVVLMNLDEEEATSLKESLALARKTGSSETVSKKFVCDFLKEKFGDAVEINTRGNYTSTGLPLADTHYVVSGEKKSCFVYMYETTGSSMILLKVPHAYAEEIKKDHPNVMKSAFPKSKDYWCSIICDDTFDDVDIENILEEAAKINLGLF